MRQHCGTSPNVDKLERLSYHELEKHRIPSKVLASGPSGRGTQENRETGAKPVRSRHCNRTHLPWMVQSAFEERSWSFCSYPFGRRRDGLLTYIGRRHEDCRRRFTGDGVPSGEYAGFHGRIAQCATSVLRMDLRQVVDYAMNCVSARLTAILLWLVLTLLGVAPEQACVDKFIAIPA